MKKNKSLSKFEMHNSSVSSKKAIHKRTKDAEVIYAETNEKIKRGLEKATASTGTPIASLALVMYLNSVALHLFNLLSELLINRLKYHSTINTKNLSVWIS